VCYKCFITIAGEDDSVDGAQVGGIILGAFMAVLLALLVVFIVAIILWKKNKT